MLPSSRLAYFLTTNRFNKEEEEEESEQRSKAPEPDRYVYGSALADLLRRQRRE
jgi:hypothetical protein